MTAEKLIGIWNLTVGGKQTNCEALAELLDLNEVEALRVANTILESVGCTLEVRKTLPVDVRRTFYNIVGDAMLIGAIAGVEKAKLK